MSIQGSVNQGLSILGALYTQTPTYKQKHAPEPAPTEEEKLLKQNEQISATLKAVGRNERKTGLSNDPEASALFKEKYDILGKLSRIDPKYVNEWIEMRPTEEEGTAKASASLKKSIEKKEYQKDRVSEFYKSLKSKSFVNAVNEMSKKIPKNLGKPSRKNVEKESINGESIK